MRFALPVFVFLALPAWAEEPFGDVVVRCLAQLKADPNALISLRFDLYY